jgi:hypothetical protein
MKKLILILAAIPLMASAATESGAKRFDRANEGSYFGDRERINPTSRELREISQEQGMPLYANKKGFPQLPSSMPGQQRPNGSEGEAPATPEVAVAQSYRTLGDAAKAGVDPLNMVKPMASKATVLQSDEGKYDIYYYVGGVLGFIVLAGLGFIFSLRTPKIREN